MTLRRLSFKLSGAWLLLAAVAVLLALSACDGGGDGDQRSPCEDSEGCKPRDISSFGLVPSQSVGAAGNGHYEAPSVEEVLEKGLHAAGASPTHLAFRGTTSAEAVRCDWRGVAKTLDQREAAIRFWLGLDEDQPLASPAELEQEFMSFVDGMSPRYQDIWRANLTTLARGGFTTERVFLTCYADYTVHEYLRWSRNPNCCL